MPMDPTGEPSKWVCRTKSYFPGANPVSGSGFLVNVPFTQKYCILTAGHNVRRPDEGRADRVEVFFPNGFTFTATAAELFVSKVYDAHPTLRDQDPSSISDYALIAVDRVKHPMTEGQAMGGCSLSVLPSRSELLHTGGTVYGYSLGNVLQTKETSPFSRPVQAQFLEYEKDTHEGVSGGPIFVSYNAGDVAIGIHNYNGRATRITLPVMLEILSWISDYVVNRTLEDLNRPGIYLHATNGSSPNLIGRPGRGPNAIFKLVPVYIAKENFNVDDDHESEHGVVLLSSQNQPAKPNTYFFVTIEKGDRDTAYRASLKEDSTPQDYNTLTMWASGDAKTLALTGDSAAMLSITPTSRKRCECGCIMQDDVVEVVDLDATEFVIARV